jgi:hypothetical protein
MLRHLGVPARLASGFRAGEFNGLSRHWTVRQYDAHAWVEAFLPPFGWIAFDPTPPEPAAGEPGFSKSLGILLDALDLWWSEHVVSYDLRKQSDLIRNARAWLWRLQGGLRNSASEMARAAGGKAAGLIRAAWNSGRIWIPAGAAAALLAAGLALLWLKGARGSGWPKAVRQARIRSDPRASITGLYADALDLLRKRGLRRNVWQTPLEFARDLKQHPFGAGFASLTEVYYRVRFGPEAGEAEIVQARDLLRALRFRLD